MQRGRNSIANPTAAAKVAKELAEKWPSISEYQALYADAQARSAILRSSNSGSAHKRLQDSVNIYRELVAKYPAYYAYKINFTQYLVILATQYSQTGESSTADAFFDEAQNCLQTMEADGENDVLIQRIAAELAAAKKAAEKLKTATKKPQG